MAPEWMIDSATLLKLNTLIEPATAILSEDVVLCDQVLNSDRKPPVPSRYLLTESNPSVLILSVNSPAEVGTNSSGRVKNG